MNNSYGSLGFIADGRRATTRDTAYTGATGHPARKDMYGAKRPDERPSPAPYNAVALLERRCVFLEEQAKRRGAEIADLRVQLAQAHVETVMATVVAPTVQVDRVGESDAATTQVAVGVEVRLQYPMRRVRTDAGVTQVWMRRREVDAQIARITYAWILLFEEAPEQPDRVLVSHFS